ncbi:hypothetical protein C8R45DRAFT_1087730 [Mycena sanguinolenta]|nr:hypothetical protein C8R45DRAFT_1087730 [Mycena sanguinolenta]
MRVGDLHVWVSVDEVDLSEFAIEYSADGKEASCWIPSECGKSFSANWKHTNSSPRNTYNALVSVDGTRCGSESMRYRDPKHPHIVSGSRNTLTDNDDLLNASISPEFGSVKVVVRDVRKVGPRKSVWHGRKRSFETPVLHERSKKAIGHSVQFGAEFPAVNAKSEIEVVQKLATFVFKYRPIELLRAQGIAPLAAKPAPAASSTEVLDLTLDDDEAEIKKLEASFRRILCNKKEVEAKPEPSSIKLEKDFVFTPGEVIDLT